MWTKTLMRSATGPGSPRRIAFEVFLNPRAGARYIAGERARDLARELLARERLHVPVGFHGRREIVGDEKVRAVGLDHCAEQLVHVGAGLFFGKGHEVSRG